MVHIINKAVSIAFSNYAHRIEAMKANAESIQKRELHNLIKRAGDITYLKQFGLKETSNYNEFCDKIPIVTYEDFQPWIERSRKGEANVLWPGKVKYFAKSSGTTNAKSKFIPITNLSLNGNHFIGGKMIFTSYLQAYPNSKIFSHVNLRLGGSAEMYEQYGTKFGDLSAIMIDNLPLWTDFVNTPNREVSLLQDWNKKLDLITEIAVKKDVTSLTGVPSWMLVLLNHILIVTGAKNIHEVWPNLEVFFHGGISFKPYQSNYDALTTKPLNYYEIYNASEGFFAFQDQPHTKDLLLMVDSGIFYEFIAIDDFDNGNRNTIPLQDVRLNENYAMVISTNGGLWRYLIGDTVRFTSISPYRVRVSGRTKHFINAFGEELIIENAEEGLKYACEQTGAAISDFTAGPIYMEEKESGAHEWIIQFDKEPTNMQKFVEALDSKLKQLNSDYDAKRMNNMTLNPPKVHVAKENLFLDWMESRGKLGGQNKVPRLSNDRSYLDPLLKLNK